MLITSYEHTHEQFIKEVIGSFFDFFTWHSQGIISCHGHLKLLIKQKLLLLEKTFELW